MSTGSKSFFTFLAGVAAAAVAAMYFKSENGRKVTNSLSQSFKKNIRGIHDANLPDWIEDIEKSTKNTSNKFKKRIGL